MLDDSRPIRRQVAQYPAPRAGYVGHFTDLCRLVEHPTPADAVPAGEYSTFEAGAAK